MIKARVYRASKKDFDCKLDNSSEIIRAKAKGNLLKGKNSIVVGDNVQLEYDEKRNEYAITSVDDRNSEIYRIIVREGKKKVTAANVDYMIILNSVSRPEYKRGIVDRFLVRAYQWGIIPIVVFNKMDQYSTDDFDIHFEVNRLKDLDVNCFEISAKFLDYKHTYLDDGFLELKEMLKGKTAIFLGQSGVGKSKTISALTEGEFLLKTQNVGRSGKGAHTTTWSELVDCKELSVIDSPGIRSFSLEDLLEEDLIDYFPDLSEYFSRCKFTNCNHAENAKGCVFNALEEGYEKRLVLSRLDSYKRIISEISTPHWKKKL